MNTSCLTKFLAAFLNLLLAAGSTISVINKRIGDDVVLDPPSLPTSPITTVMWLHNNNIAVEWDGKNTEQFTIFTDQSGLDSSTGKLTIHNLSEKFNGEYKVDINGNLFDTSIILKVMSPVPKPYISKSCNDEMTLCNLTCEGNVSASDPMPTYKWKFNNAEKNGYQITITPESTADEFICELENPVSLESSKPFDNPFQKSQEKEEKGGFNKIGIVVIVCLVAVVIVIALVHRVKSGMWFFQKDSMPWESDFWRPERPEPEPANEEPAEGQPMMPSS